MALEIEVTIGSVLLNQNLAAGSDFYVLKDTPQLLSTLSTRKTDKDKQGGHGTEDSLSQYQARILPFKGEIHAASQSARKTMEKNLIQAIGLSVAQDFDGDDGYKLLLITDEDGIGKQIYAKVIEPPEFELLDIAEPEMRKFSFVMYAKDPALYAQILSSQVGPESFLTTTLTVQDGELPSFGDGDLMVIQDTYAATLTATSNGTFGTPPVIVVSGPSTDPRVKNVTTGREMDFSNGAGVTLLSGETLTINVANQTIVKTNTLGAESDQSGALTTDSDWIFIEPGSNDFTLQDATPADLSGQLSVQWRDAWI
jgi:hypothetical protein